MADDLGEKTEDATPKRRQESREEGQVAKSQDLGGALLLIVATAVIALAAAWMLEQGRIVVGNVLAGHAVDDPLRPESVWSTSAYVFNSGLRAAAPLLLILWLAAGLTQMGQFGWLFPIGVMHNL